VPTVISVVSAPLCLFTGQKTCTLLEFDSRI